jgi:hypothetical protein
MFRRLFKKDVEQRELKSKSSEELNPEQTRLKEIHENEIKPLKLEISELENQKLELKSIIAKSEKNLASCDKNFIISHSHMIGQAKNYKKSIKEEIDFNPVDFSKSNNIVLANLSKDIDVEVSTLNEYDKSFKPLFGFYDMKKCSTITYYDSYLIREDRNKVSLKDMDVSDDLIDSSNLFHETLRKCMNGIYCKYICSEYLYHDTDSYNDVCSKINIINQKLEIVMDKIYNEKLIPHAEVLI